MPLDNDDPADRKALVVALRERGLPAYEYHSGGGAFHVAVDVIDEGETGNLLQIATGSGDSPCELGLMGWRDGESWEAAEWARMENLADAVDWFVEQWGHRGRLADEFRSGALGT